LEAYPVVTRERARLSFASDLSPRRFLQDLRDAQAADANTALVILSVDGQGERVQLRELDGWRDRLAYATVILPPEVGGLALGIPDPEVAGRLVPDVADEPGRRERWHVAVTNGAWEATPIVDGLPVDVPLILEGGSFAAAVASLEASRSLESLLVIPDTQDDEDIASGTVYLVSREPHLPDEQDLASVRATTQGLEEHLSRVGSAAEALTRALHLSDGLASALRLAGELHDRGKARRWWQLAVGNTGPEPLAKCFGRATNWALMGGYRHEFGSLLEVATLDQVTQHPLAELVLHLVAAHHGHARPGFAERAFDRGFSLDENRAAAREAALRFVRLQREYGWWTLAYLEALLKAADAMGSVETPQC
jgi:CRISPR-associated endonuclease/helicase Cas3